MDVAPPAVDPEILTRNLAALRSVAPELAAALAAPLPEEERYAPAWTRDRQISLRRTDADGQVHWFARSSIPQARALALLDQFAIGSGNILLPGVSSGHEARLLCDRIGPPRAVFVWETSPLALRLALRLIDLSEPMARERLVPLVCPLDALASTFVAWLRTHPGHLPPERLMMYPWQSHAELEAFRSVIEGVHRDIETERAAALAKVGKAGVATGNLDRPSLGLLALHPRDLNWATLDALAGAARSLGGAATISDIRTPGDLHPLARAERFRQASSLHAAILLDIPRGDVTELLPEQLPVVTWLTGQLPPDSLTARIGTGDALAVPNARLADLAAGAGIPRSRITICPPPCLTPTEAASDTNRDIDIAVFADLVPTEPATFGHTLETHAQVWNAAVELLKKDLDSFSEPRVASTFSEAERRLKIRIDEPRIREAMVSVLTQFVGPGLLWRRLVAEMTDHRLQVQLWGSGWPSEAPVKGTRQPSLAERAAICRRARVVVHIDPSGSANVLALLAAGCGAVLLTRAEPHHRLAGGLATLLEPGKEMLTFTSARELLTQVRRLLSDANVRKQIADRAAARCLTEHSPAARLKTLLDLALAGHSA